MSPVKASRAFAATAVAVAAVIGASAPASASNYIPVELPLATTAAHGLGCAGDVWAIGNVYPDGDVAGTVDLQVQGWLKVLGVPAPWCSVTATVHWHNHDTGARGSGSVFLGAGNGTPFFWIRPQLGNVRLVTGAGNVTFTLTTDLPHAPSTTTFRVY
ncbi:hypothetical protein IU433_03215 [Nocardia puris]|uniref:Secreted protein n=1 Tax=Nocardia puris TaxID=208602 RepID=A0A366DWB7_9NOCA|nr:hypothetical protein [Nocardia puris]MBF6210037.1 hypothetical protein [Nocardia puris]MBF6368228.1 hypothetical protein [Nocardia puris]MBF6458053.1 hypothetical protein [Nocardia puris]RBO94215.1 hypothetical protein DFR74_102638 [Nocardia puris]